MQPTVPRLFQLAVLAMTLVLAGCSTQPRLPAVPRHETSEASFLGIPDARFSLSGDTAALTASFAASEQRRRLSGETGTDHLLAISGGGENGAFGAGLLYGWTERGDRPQFRLVTGVSTGALTAPFAFLGSRYDAQLKAVYTTIQRDNIAQILPIITILNGDSVADSRPLAALIATHITPEMVEEIGREYRKGRVLMIGTTNLDIYRMYLVTQRDRVDFNLAYISSRFTVPYEKPFDPVYMNALFEFGRNEIRTNQPWLKRPPGYRP